MFWHLITPEYPPQPGGVSDYTQLVANGLAAAGDDVHVWGPSEEQRPEVRGQESAIGTRRSEVGGQKSEDRRQKGDSETADRLSDGRVMVHRELGRFTRSDLRRVGRMLDDFKAPRRLLVQWVPHGYGHRAMNVSFCLWLWRRARQGDCVEVIVHEPFLSFSEGSWKQSGVAAVHRVMMTILLRATGRVWMTIPAWEKYLRPYALGRRVEFNWLPVASNIPVVDNPDEVEAIRARYTSESGAIVGHFGTYDRHTTELLLSSVPAMLQNGKPQTVLLVGRGSELMRSALVLQHPEIQDRLHATGELNARDLSLHLSACDVMLQPYIDGVSSRRTSTMVALAHGVPVVTTVGRLTEPLWAQSEAVALTPVSDLLGIATATQRLLQDTASRKRMGAAGKALYAERFDVAGIIPFLRDVRTQSIGNVTGVRS